MGQRGEIGPFFPSPRPSPSRGEGAMAVVPRLTRPPHLSPTFVIGEPSGMTERGPPSVIPVLPPVIPASHLSFPSPTCHSRRQLAGIQGLFLSAPWRRLRRRVGLLRVPLAPLTPALSRKGRGRRKGRGSQGCRAASHAASSRDLILAPLCHSAPPGCHSERSEESRFSLARAARA